MRYAFLITPLIALLALAVVTVFVDAGNGKREIPPSETPAIVEQTLANMSELNSYEARLSVTGEGPAALATLKSNGTKDYSMSVQFPGSGGDTYEQVTVGQSSFFRECEDCEWQTGELLPLVRYSLPSSATPRLEVYALLALGEAIVLRAEESDGSFYVEGAVNHLAALYRHEVAQYEAFVVDPVDSCDLGGASQASPCHEITFEEEFEEQISPLTVDRLDEVPMSQISAWITDDRHVERIVLTIPALTEGNLLSGRHIEVEFQNLDETEVLAPQS